MAKKTKFPKDLGACLRLLAKLKKAVDAGEVALKATKDEEAALRAHLLDTFKKTQLNGARGSGIAIAVTSTDVPQLDDFDKFMAYASKKANWDLLNRQVNSAAWRERLEAKKRVPGVSLFTRVGLRVSKA
jgi:hypothetical protein